MPNGRTMTRVLRARQGIACSPALRERASDGKPRAQNAFRTASRLKLSHHTFPLTSLP